MCFRQSLSITFHKIHQRSTKLWKSYAFTRSYAIRFSNLQASVVAFNIRNQTHVCNLHIQRGFWICNELHNITWTPGTPPDDWIASTISLEVSMLDPWLRWKLMCILSNAAFLSPRPLTTLWVREVQAFHGNPMKATCKSGSHYSSPTVVAFSIVLPIKDGFQLSQVWLQLSNDILHNWKHRVVVLVAGLENVYKCHNL